MKTFLLAPALFVLSATTAFSAQNPWVGRWKPDTAKSTFVEVEDTLIISSPAKDVLRWEYPAIKFKMQGKPDGSNMALSYPNMPTSLTESVTILTPRKLAYSVKVDGKLVQHGTDELSADGNTLTAVSWTVGKYSKRRTEVFHRQ